jgi:hypothetical protein
MKFVVNIFEHGGCKVEHWRKLLVKMIGIPAFSAESGKSIPLVQTFSITEIQFGLPLK